MKKALMIASVSSMIEQFNMDNICILQDLGYTVDVACNFEKGSTMPSERVLEFKERLKNLGISTYQVPIPRSPFAFPNIMKSYKIIKEILELNKYEIVHCHSPIGGVVARLASRKFRKEGTNVIYTAHGFHFYKGAPLINWLIYYTIEKLMSNYTDVLITINTEDNDRAKRFCEGKKVSVQHINGIGIDTQKTEVKVDSASKRAELGIMKDTLLMTSVGELIKRKNHRVIIQALAKLGDCNITYLICGTGPLETELRELARELKVDDKIVFAGYRADIKEILEVSDFFLFPSFQEGLSVALLEAMSAGLPIICSQIRGNTDLIRENKGGYLVETTNIGGYVEKIEELIINERKRKEYGCYNQTIVKEYDKKAISSAMRIIYENVGKQ